MIPLCMRSAACTNNANNVYSSRLHAEEQESIPPPRGFIKGSPPDLAHGLFLNWAFTNILERLDKVPQEPLKTRTRDFTGNLLPSPRIALTPQWLADTALQTLLISDVSFGMLHSPTASYTPTDLEWFETGDSNFLFLGPYFVTDYLRQSRRYEGRLLGFSLTMLDLDQLSPLLKEVAPQEVAARMRSTIAQTAYYSALAETERADVLVQAGANAYMYGPDSKEFRHFARAEHYLDLGLLERMEQWVTRLAAENLNKKLFNDLMAEISRNYAQVKATYENFYPAFFDRPNWQDTPVTNEERQAFITVNTFVGYFPAIFVFVGLAADQLFCAPLADETIPSISMFIEDHVRTRLFRETYLNRIEPRRQRREPPTDAELEPFCNWLRTTGAYDETQIRMYVESLKAYAPGGDSFQ